MNLHECSKMLSAFSSMPGFQNPPRSLTNQWSKFARHEIILFPNSCTEVNLVTQLDHSWANICPTYVQYNTYGIFFTKKIFKPLFHSLIVTLSSCSQKVAKANPGWNQLRRTGKSSTGLQLLSAETPPVSKSTFSSWPSYYQKAASFSKSCKGQFRKPIE